MARAYLIDIVRSPFARARPDGGLHHMHPVDLFAHTLEGLVTRTGIDPAAVDDVIAGCVIQVGEQAANIAEYEGDMIGFAETQLGRGQNKVIAALRQAQRHISLIAN